MVINKSFNFDEVLVGISLVTFVKERNVPLSLSFVYEATLYWCVYFFENKIQNIVKFQAYLAERVLEHNHNWSEQSIEWLQKEVLQFLGETDGV